LIGINAGAAKFDDPIPIKGRDPMRLVGFAAAFALAFAGSCLAQTADPSWLDDLKFQIEGQKKCKIIYLIQVREGELAGRKTYHARVQCEDGRMFDADRIGEFESFKFQACEQQVC
jgi:hypothetical protein